MLLQCCKLHLLFLFFCLSSSAAIGCGTLPIPFIFVKFRYDSVSYFGDKPEVRDSFSVCICTCAWFSLRFCKTATYIKLHVIIQTGKCNIFLYLSKTVLHVAITQLLTLHWDILFVCHVIENVLISYRVYI